MYTPFKLLFSVFAFSLLFISCKKDKKTDDHTTVFKATLDGASEVPPNNSTATGSATLTYDEDKNTFNVVVTYTGLTPTAGHIHLGKAGENGPVAFPFTSLQSPINLTSSALTTEQVNALFSDSMYVNLHTTTYPGGEIRGQLMKQ